MWGSIVWLVISLMLLRLIPVIIVQDKFKNMKITIVGFKETGFQILFLVCILIALKYARHNNPPNTKEKYKSPKLIFVYLNTLLKSGKQNSIILFFRG